MGLSSGQTSHGRSTLKIPKGSESGGEVTNPTPQVIDVGTEDEWPLKMGWGCVIASLLYGPQCHGFLPRCSAWSSRQGDSCPAGHRLGSSVRPVRMPCLAAHVVDLHSCSARAHCFCSSTLCTLIISSSANGLTCENEIIKARTYAVTTHFSKRSGIHYKTSLNSKLSLNVVRFSKRFRFVKLEGA